MAIRDLTPERARELFTYCPNTGQLFRKPSSHLKSGRIVKTPKHSSYISVWVDGKSYGAHCLAWIIYFGKYPIYQIDHADQNRQNNRIKNLRDIPQILNSQNISLPRKNNKVGLLGASWHKRDRRWRAAIRSHGKRIWIGYFDTAEAAHAAYVDAKRKHHEANTL